MQKEAVQSTQAAFRISGNTDALAVASTAFGRGGYRAVVETWINYWSKESQTRYVSPVFLAGLKAQLGEREETLTLLEQGYKEHSPLLLSVPFDPAYDFLHSDERYRSIIKNVGVWPAS
jgi:hypothetical protein